MGITAIIEKHGGTDKNGAIIWLMDSTFGGDTSQTARLAIKLSRVIARPIRVTWVDDMGGQKVFRPPQWVA